MHLNPAPPSSSPGSSRCEAAVNSQGGDGPPISSSAPRSVLESVEWQLRAGGPGASRSSHSLKFSTSASSCSQRPLTRISPLSSITTTPKQPPGEELWGGTSPGSHSVTSTCSWEIRSKNLKPAPPAPSAQQAPLPHVRCRPFSARPQVPALVLTYRLTRNTGRVQESSLGPL